MPQGWRFAPDNGVVTALDGITRPTLVVDRARAERNIARMAAKASASGARFRPHVKTHQSPGIAEWYRAAGVDVITVSSVAMAERFADHGWRDITVAFPFNPREAEALRALTARGVRLALIVDSAAAARRLDASGLEVDAWIEVDAGYHRTGVDADHREALVELATLLRAAAPRLRFAGLLTHSGHTYGGRSRDEVLRIHDASVAAMRRAQASLASAGIEAPISIGDTPGCDAADGFEGIDEIRPGNFVLLDLQQLQTGTCAEDDLALAVACPVVDCYPDRGALVVHGGSAHFSRDAADGPDGRPMYGRVAEPADDGRGWRLAEPAARLTSLAQEHGTITGPAEVLGRYDVGSLVLVVPAHACLACASTRSFVTLDGQPL
jgi:D-serine deaminase-like pyridoxal phosphate-dependent protein